jgi:hypothetical protein
MIGEMYDRLTIIKKLGYIKGSLKVLCLCGCGNYKEVYYGNLKNGSTKSCGCLRAEVYVASRRNLKGLKFGKLTVISVVGKNKNGKFEWDCECECGNKCIVVGRDLLSKTVKSCGCLVNFDITSQKFGRLTALRKVGINKSRNSLWECVCECGNTTVVSSNHLRDGHTTSCGCFWREQIWKGGLSREFYCQNWTKDLKELVKERDGYKCMNPCCSKKYELLVVHHIDYNKKSCGLENLITVCTSCNGKANFDREFHEAWYKAIMYRRYGYKY